MECGGGLSTYYISSLIKERGGHLYTIEDNKDWADILQGFLSAQNLDKFVSIIYAPLVKTELAMNRGSWYNENLIRDAILGSKIDLLLVDGPVASGNSLRYARYPAVPFFKPFLSENYTIILDDINRQGEQEILKKWENELSISFERYPMNGSVAIGRSQEYFHIA